MKQYFFSILCALYTLLPSVGFAAPQYTVQPLVIDEHLEARDIVTKNITLTNTGSQPITLYPSVNNISLKDGAIEEFIPPVMTDRTQSLAAWIEIHRGGIDLQPGASKQISLTFRVHPNPVAGTYHAFVGFGNGTNRDEAERQVMQGSAPGVVVTVTIDDKKVTFLKLAKFVVDRFVVSNDNQAAVFTFTNPGDEVVVPKGEIIMYNTRGEEVAAVPVNADNVSIAPKAEHTFATQLPADGFFGKYKAFLSVEYGTNEKASLQDTDFFYVFPIKILLIVFGVLITLVIIVSWYIHTRYFDTSLAEDGNFIAVHVRDGVSEAKDHDLDLTKL